MTELKFLKPKFDNKKANHYAYRIEGAEKINSYEAFCSVARKIEKDLKAAGLPADMYAKNRDYLKDVRDRKRISYLKIQEQERKAQEEQKQKRKIELEKSIETEKATIDSILVRAEKHLSEDNPYFKDIASLLEVARVQLKQSHLFQSDRNKRGYKLDNIGKVYRTKLQKHIEGQEQTEYKNYESQVASVLNDLPNKDPYEAKKAIQNLRYELLNRGFGKKASDLEKRLEEASEKIDLRISSVQEQEQKQKEALFNDNYQELNKEVSEIYKCAGMLGPYGVRDKVIELRQKISTVYLRNTDKQNLSKELDALWHQASSRISGNNNAKEAPKKLLDRLTTLNAYRINTLIPDTQRALKNATNPTYRQEKQAFLKDLEGQVEQTKKKIKQLEKQLESP